MHQHFRYTSDFLGPVFPFICFLYFSTLVSGQYCHQLPVNNNNNNNKGKPRQLSILSTHTRFGGRKKYTNNNHGQVKIMGRLGEVPFNMP